MSGYKFSVCHCGFGNAHARGDVGEDKEGKYDIYRCERGHVTKVHHVIAKSKRKGKR